MSAIRTRPDMEWSCPRCQQRARWEGNPFRPFCSERCKFLDLESWMSERYRVPLEEEPPKDPDGSDEQQDTSANGSH